MPESSATTRLNKRMAELGLCSRREADDWIAKGWVKVDGAVATMGLQVGPHARIEVDAKARGQQREQVTILLHKPVGYVSGQAEEGYQPAKVLVQPRTRWKGDTAPRRFAPAQLQSLVPAGRLDIDSTGLLVLTQDGRIARQLIGEDSAIEKEYLVRVAYGAVATDVQAWGANFVAFTGHKMCGPTGIGVLWGTEDALNATPPFLTGGEMILNVTKDGFTHNELPWKFEAGTPPIAEAVGLGAAVDYLTDLGMEAIREHEVALTGYALRSLTERFGDDLTIHGPSEPAERGGVLSFTYGDLHPHDLTQVFDQHGVCVRAGHHCAKVLMREVLGVAATARASLYVYNDEADVDVRRAGYYGCKAKVDAVFGGRGMFRFDANVDEVYERLYLRREKLSDDDTAAVVAANKPTFGAAGFPVLLARIAASLVSEAADMSLDALTSLADGYRTAADEDPR